MQANIWEFVFEHLEEHRKEVINSPVTVSHGVDRDSIDLLFLAQYRSEPTDLGTKGSPNMLRAVRNQVLYGGHNFVQQERSVNQFAEAYEVVSCMDGLLLEKTYREFALQ